MVTRRRHYGPTAALLASAMLIWPSAITLAKPRDEPAPLFMVFKAFCLDTKAQLTAVQAAVRTAPYKLRERASLAFAPPLTKASTKAWDFELGGHRMGLEVGVSKTSDGRRTVRKNGFCTVLSNADESASMNQALQWLGITEKLDLAQPLFFGFVWPISGPKEVKRLGSVNTLPVDSWGFVLNQTNGYGYFSVGYHMSHHFNAR